MQVHTRKTTKVEEITTNILWAAYYNVHENCCWHIS